MWKEGKYGEDEDEDTEDHEMFTRTTASDVGHDNITVPQTALTERQSSVK